MVNVADAPVLCHATGPDTREARKGTIGDSVIYYPAAPIRGERGRNYEAILPPLPSGQYSAGSLSWPLGLTPFKLPTH